MTVISTDGAGSLAKSVASNIEQGLQISSDLTGMTCASCSPGWGRRRRRAPGPPVLRGPGVAD
jgi:flotillin